jgi:hypothetical integral membrane protein (TIGR02206 family)
VPWYGATHLVPLAIFAAGLVLVVWLGRRQRGLAGPSRTSRAGAILVLAIAVPSVLRNFLVDFDVASSVPLHLCNLAWIFVVWALWTHHPYPVAVSYLWGLVLTVQALVTPALGQDFPHPRYFSFWAVHILIVWAAVYLVIGLRKVPRWRDYGAVLATTVVWAVGTYAFNLAYDTNYGYLMHKPEASILDYFGPWPWYIVVEAVILIAIWALLTWVAQRGRGPELTPPGSGTHRRRARSLRS